MEHTVHIVQVEVGVPVPLHRPPHQLQRLAHVGLLELGPHRQEEVMAEQRPRHRPVGGVGPRQADENNFIGPIVPFVIVLNTFLI